MIPKKLDYNILVTEIAGDKLINNLITNEIRKISDPNSLNKITLKLRQIIVKSQYQKTLKDQFQIIGWLWKLIL